MLGSKSGPAISLHYSENVGVVYPHDMAWTPISCLILYCLFALLIMIQLLAVSLGVIVTDACTVNLVIYRCKVFFNRMKKGMVSKQSSPQAGGKGTKQNNLQ